MFTSIHRVLCALLAAIVAAVSALAFLYALGAGDFRLGTSADPLEVADRTQSIQGWVADVEASPIDAVTLLGLAAALVVGLALVWIAVHRDPVKYLRVGEDAGVSRSAVQDVVDGVVDGNVRVDRHRTKVSVRRRDRTARIAVRTQARDGVDTGRLDAQVKAGVTEALQRTGVPVAELRTRVRRTTRSKAGVR